jgi:GT2 family glycosyltransferase
LITEASTESSSSSEPFRAPGTVDITVIIANYNACALLESCLESIYSNPPTRSFEVIVMDDASPDSSASMVRTKYPQARLFVNPQNVGYARSNNHAIEESRGRYVYLLNSDAQLFPGALDAMAEFLESHPEAGAAGSMLYNGDGTIQASVKAFPSFKSAFIGARSSLSRWIPWLSRNELLHWKTEKGEPFQAGYVSSASIMIPRSVAREVGPLDVRLWYFIDADYCRRIWNLGCPVYCVPKAKAIHLDHHGGTKASFKQRFRSLIRFHYGAYIYFHKHSGRGVMHPIRVFVILGLGARFVISTVLQLFKEIFGSEGKVYDRRPGHHPHERKL